MVDEAATPERAPLVQRLLGRIQNEAGMRRPAGAPADDPAGIGVDDEGDVDEPRLSRDVEPAPAKAGVKSDTHSMFDAGARNCRFTRSSGHGEALSLTVVRTSLSRITPARPIARIRRATVQRATSNPSRRSCRQTLRTP